MRMSGLVLFPAAQSPAATSRWQPPWPQTRFQSATRGGGGQSGGSTGITMAWHGSWLLLHHSLPCSCAKSDHVIGFTAYFFQSLSSQQTYPGLLPRHSLSPAPVHRYTTHQPGAIFTEAGNLLALLDPPVLIVLQHLPSHNPFSPGLRGTQTNPLWLQRVAG